MGEKLPLDELTDIATQIHPQQTSPFKEKMILETAKHIENKQEKLDQTVELLCSVVSSPRHPQPQYQIQPQPSPSSSTNNYPLIRLQSINPDRSTNNQVQIATKPILARQS